MKMTVVSVATESLQTLREWYDRFLRSYPERELQLCTWYVAREDQIRCSSARMMEDIRTADLVLIDLMGCSEDMAVLRGAIRSDDPSRREICGADRAFSPVGPTMLTGVFNMQILIMCRSLTRAQRSELLLERRGIGASVVKAPQALRENGCGYGEIHSIAKNQGHEQCLPHW